VVRGHTATVQLWSEVIQPQCSCGQRSYSHSAAVVRGHTATVQLWSEFIQPQCSCGQMDVCSWWEPCAGARVLCWYSEKI